MTPDQEYLERAARVWCLRDTSHCEMQAPIANIIAILLAALQAADSELRLVRSGHSNEGSRAEVLAVTEKALELVQ